MACARYGDALSDVAAGAAASADLAAHLATCEGCRAELAALRRALAVADEEMARLLTGEPSPELVARIRTAVAESESGSAPGWRVGWLWPALAAAALVVALAVVVARRPTQAPVVAVETHTPRPPEAAQAREAVPEPVGASAMVSGAERMEPSHLALRRRAPAEPEVLVPAGEAEALLRLVALVNRNRLTPPVLGAAGQPSADLAELRPIEIKPLEIVPLDPAETSGT